jgi:hypothetical protein
MRLSFLLIGSMFVTTSYADTIERYMNIANNIPKMEMKADPEAQTWVRSARNVLNLTSEAIVETLTLVNASAAQQGHALFCVPADAPLNAARLNHLIQETYHQITSPSSEKDNMTVSEVALLGLTQKYPCQAQGNNRALTPAEMVHVSVSEDPLR